jgi:hypothetical protein
MHLVEEKFRLRVHGAATASESSVVGMWRRRRRWWWWCAPDRLLQVAAPDRIDACWELRRMAIDGIEPISTTQGGARIDETEQGQRRDRLSLIPDVSRIARTEQGSKKHSRG